MAYTLIYFPTGAEMRFIGTTSGADIIAAKKEVLEQEYPAGLQFFLVDMMSVTGFDVTSTDVERIAELNTHYVQTHEPYVVAIAAQRELIYGLSRMYEGLVDQSGITTHVSKSRKEAVQWLRERQIHAVDA